MIQEKKKKTKNSICFSFEHAQILYRPPETLTSSYFVSFLFPIILRTLVSGIP